MRLVRRVIMSNGCPRGLTSELRGAPLHGASVLERVVRLSMRLTTAITAAQTITLIVPQTINIPRKPNRSAMTYGKNREVIAALISTAGSNAMKRSAEETRPIAIRTETLLFASLARDAQTHIAAATEAVSVDSVVNRSTFHASPQNSPGWHHSE